MPSLQSGMVDGLATITIRVRQPNGNGWRVSPDLRVGLDTGAAELYFAPLIMDDLEFNPCRRERVQTGAGPANATVYQVEAAVLVAGKEPDDGDWFSIEAWSVPHMPSAKSDVLAGWSFLKRCVFVYDGLNNIFTLTW